MHLAGRQAPTAVVAAPAGESHEFGALLLAFVALLHGFRPVYLGPNLSGDDLLEAVRRTRASLLLLSMVSNEPAGAARTTAARVRKLAERLPSRVSLLLSGREAEALRTSLPTDSVVRTLEELEQRLSEARPSQRGTRLRGLKKCSM